MLMGSGQTLRSRWWALWAVLFLLIYGNAAGRGFIKDDFVWVAESSVQSWSDLPAALHRDNGFYRPVVTLTFALNRALHGLAPKGYGLFNLALAVISAVAVGVLARGLGLRTDASILAALVWLYNFHAIGGSILWISGRTALLVTAASVFSTACLLAQRPVWAAGFLALALASKEEAVVLPLVQMLWLWIGNREHPAGRNARRVGQWALLSSGVVAAYLAVRATTGAMTPWTAPSYYRLDVGMARLIANGSRYSDWILTFPAICAAIGAVTLRRLARPSPSERRTLMMCVLWITGTLTLTIFLPARSELYACLPSVGAAILCAVLIESMWSGASPQRQRSAAWLAIVLPLILAPVHYLRTERMVRIAELSTRTLRDLAGYSSALPDGATVVVIDDRSDRRITLEAAFGTLLGDAYTLVSGRQLRFWIEPAVANAADSGLVKPCEGCADLVLTLRNGHLEP